MNRRRVLVIALLAAFTLAAAECDRFTGMGWMQSASCPHADFPEPPGDTPVDELLDSVPFPPPEPVDPTCDKRATFGFVIEPTADSDVGDFAGSYSDPSFTGVGGSVNGVKLKGAGALMTLTRGSPDPRVEHCIGGVLLYESTDPKLRGIGNLQLIACDIDEPGIDQDALYIHVLTGPYAGYVNFGLVQGGNLQ